MNYNLKRPCPKCPFRTDIRPYLRQGRLADVGEALQGGGTFVCHETIDKREEHCAGALLVLEHENDGARGGPGCMVNQMARVMARLGVFNPDELDHESPVFHSFEEADEAQR